MGGICRRCGANAVDGHCSLCGSNDIKESPGPPPPEVPTLLPPPQAPSRGVAVQEATGTTGRSKSPAVVIGVIGTVAVVGIVGGVLSARGGATNPAAGGSLAIPTATVLVSEAETGPGSPTSADAPTASQPASASPPASFPAGILVCSDYFGGPSEASAAYGARSATTTCEFAANVYAAARPQVAAGRTTFEVTATSPVTKKAYVMSCRPDGGGMTVCTGGNQAEVWLP